MAQGKTTDQTSLYRDRRSFAKIPDVMDVPNLIAIQTDSFEFFKGEGLAQAFQRHQPHREQHEGHVRGVRSPRVRRAEVHGRRVQGEGRLLPGAAVRRDPLHQPRDRRDQGAGRVHGRLPAHDAARHLHHQRHRARRGVPARALPGRLLRRRARQDVRQDHLQREGHPEPRRVARVRDRQARHPVRAHRPQAQAAGHAARARPRPGRDARGDHRAPRLRRDGAAHARPRPGHHEGRVAHRAVQALPSRRAAHHRLRPHAPRGPVLQPAALRPGEGRPLQDQQEARLRPGLRGLHAHRRRHRAHDAVHRGACTPAPRTSRPTTSTTSATAASARWAS